MIRFIHSFLIFILATICSFAQERGSEFYLPAEWEQQERVHLAWFGSERRDSVLCRVIEALQPEIPITLNIPADSLSDKIKAKLHQIVVIQMHKISN